MVLCLALTFTLTSYLNEFRVPMKFSDSPEAKFLFPFSDLAWAWTLDWDLATGLLKTRRGVNSTVKPKHGLTPPPRLIKK